MYNERLRNEMIVRHFKKETNDFSPTSHLYEIIDTNVKILDDLKKYGYGERYVLFQSLFNDKDGLVRFGALFIEKYEDFISKVNKEEYPNINQEYKFEEEKDKSVLEIISRLT